MNKPKNKIKGLKVNEVSLVDRPANSLSVVTLFKRENTGIVNSEKTEGETPVKFEDMLKSFGELLKPLEEQVNVVKSKLEETPVSVEKPEAELQKAEQVVDLQKQLEDIKKQNEDLKKAAAEANAKAEEAELVKRAAAELPNLPGDEASKAELLKLAQGNDTLIGILKSHNELLGKSMKEVGSSSNTTEDLTSGNDRIAKMADELIAKDPSLTVAMAVTKVLETPEGQEAYLQSKKEGNK